MLRLRFTTLVGAPLTVAYDVAQATPPPWPGPLVQVAAVRPEHDAYAAAPGGRRRLAHTRRFTATGAGTLVTEQVDWEPRVPPVLRGAVEELVLRPRVLRAMRDHQEVYAAAASRAAAGVVQVVGAAIVRGDRVLVARRAGGPYDGCWEFPGGKVEPGEPELDGLVRECREELGVVVAPQAFLGEVVLDGVVGGGAPGASTLRVWWAREASGELAAAEHAELRWVRAEELAALDWIPADRPLLPAVRALLARS
ncbi:(deoxy)nucleoside triphosphate pyrophosphohydrolase [Geodermatophilus sp. YIM 151500]|uniref:(deoxy)nucleoside triphosphate pyrophosphohydrolase n=1 Tax=Geodermatophilus sp. YIM 151500 TaxID=2984531 RepID=UPI0021E36860|nr:(deoxy)nucleoside triphosphate pyrophosphohydrolase [Geodermatophilus sp. YIM 151500]MCV2489397.1 (deoxy)nucleoside triphosphate pyrophosphohydrolase [Geodermatophilus sp. YIM 151500]